METNSLGYRTESLKKAVSALVVLVFLISAVAVIPIPTASATPTVWTDKADYAPGETVVISGSGFQADMTLVVQMLRPLGTDLLTVETDGSGSFTLLYELSPDRAMEGTYTILVINPENVQVLATTIFTDSPHFSFGTITASPTSIQLPSGSPTTTTVSVPVTNTASLTSTVHPDVEKTFIDLFEAGTANKINSQFTITRTDSITQITAGATATLTFTVTTTSSTTYTGAVDVKAFASGKVPPTGTPVYTLHTDYSWIASSVFTVSAPSVTQYQVTFKASGLDTDAGTNVVLKVDVTPLDGWDYSYAYNDLTGAGTTITVNSGTQIKYEFQSPVATSNSAKEYHWASATGSGNFPSSSPQTGTYSITSGSILTGSYDAYYKVRFDASSNVKGDSTAPIVQVAGADKTAANLPFTTDWIKSGNSLSYSYYSLVASSSSPSDTQYRWASTSGLGQTLQSNTFNVTAGGTITATYKTQYKVHVEWSGLGSDANLKKAVTVTVDGTPTNLNGGDSFFDQWVDEGKSVTYTYEDPIIIVADEKQYRLDHVSGTSNDKPTHTFSSLSAAVTETGVYQAQYKVKVGWSIGGDASGKIVTITVAGSPIVKNAGDSAYDEWLDSGTTVSYAYEDIVNSTVTGKRYNLYYVTGDSTDASHDFGAILDPITESATYKTQYLLTIQTNGLPSSYPTNVYLDGSSVGTASDTSPYTEWFDKDSDTGTIGVDDPVAGDTGIQYVFDKWNEDSSTDNPRATETMNEPKTFTADYKTQVITQVKVVPVSINTDSQGKWVMLKVKFPFTVGFSSEEITMTVDGVTYTIPIDRFTLTINNDPSCYVYPDTSAPVSFDDTSYELHIKYSRTSYIQALNDDGVVKGETYTVSLGNEVDGAMGVLSNEVDGSCLAIVGSNDQQRTTPNGV